MVSRKWTSRKRRLDWLSLPHEGAAGAQDPERLREDPVLQLGARHVVQHREADDRVVRRVRQRHVRPVRVHDPGPLAPGDVQQPGGLRVDLDGGQVGHLFDEDTQVGAVTRPDLQDVRAQFDPVERPGQQSFPGLECPLLGTADPLVHLIHRHTADARPGPPVSTTG